MHWMEKAMSPQEIFHKSIEFAFIPPPFLKGDDTLFKSEWSAES